jgi:hypothetical protein
MLALKALFGERRTLNGHRPRCPCDGCWTDRKTAPHYGKNANEFKIYREWWEVPMVLIGISAISLFACWLVGIL